MVLNVTIRMREYIVLLNNINWRRLCQKRDHQNERVYNRDYVKFLFSPHTYLALQPFNKNEQKLLSSRNRKGHLYHNQCFDMYFAPKQNLLVTKVRFTYNQRLLRTKRNRHKGQIAGFKRIENVRKYRTDHVFIIRNKSEFNSSSSLIKNLRSLLFKAYVPKQLI